MDKDIFTEEYLTTIMRKRHVPIKALILDQAVISGVGNWVADESLYHARLHPEQYCNEFSDEEIKRLHNSIKYVCQTAVDLLADSDKFPDHWLFNHRWDKGKKGSGTLPNGEKLAWVTVGGRTSCYAPDVQKKTGHVAPGIKEEPVGGSDADEKPKKGKGKKAKAQNAGDKVKPKDGNTKAAESQFIDEDKTKSKGTKAEKSKARDADEEDDERPPLKKTKVKTEPVKETPKVSKAKPGKTNGTNAVVDLGRRRSARLSNGA